jgi:glutathione S-transferase
VKAGSSNNRINGMTPTTRPILYSFRRCPYAIRARLALHSAQIAVELREVSLRNKPAELLALSPQGTVPVLQLPDARVLEHSLDIMQWALSQNDPEQWLHSAAPDRDAALIANNDGLFKQALDLYKYASRHPERDATVSRDAAVVHGVLPLEQALHMAQALRTGQAPSGHDALHPVWLGGQHPCLADAALFPFVRQFAAVDPAWFKAQPWPQTLRWLHQWEASTAFQAVMLKQSVWAI